MPSAEFLMQDNFCVLPWQHLTLQDDGTTQLCCQSTQVEDIDGKPLSLYEQSIAEIWNGGFMRAIRGAMVQGVRVRSCTKCWEVEDRGGISRRLEMNGAFFRAGGSIAQLKAEAIRQEFACDSLPVDYQLNMGNACNLKCRTCSSGSSSKIAADPVHLRWEGKTLNKAAAARQDAYGIDDNDAAPSVTRVNRLGRGLPWYKDAAFLLGELLADAQRIRALQIIGGEPLVIRMLAPIVEHLVSRGRPELTTMGLTTNGTRFDAALMERLERFGQISISVSIDGQGPMFDYIRYPGRWSEVLANLERYAALPQVTLSIVPTFHIYNALHFADLLRFCEARNIRPISNPLWTPHQLRAEVLPPRARREAARRLRAFSASSRVPLSAMLANTFAQRLEDQGDAIDQAALDEFMLYTNDLDQGRSLRFRDVCPEVIELMAADGVIWNEALRHAMA
jgi:Radical SAM superfamily/Iron-sulfur cluster-binding domain